jgi:hypothetical protein
MNLHLFRALCPKSKYEWSALPISVDGRPYQLIIPGRIARAVLRAVLLSNRFTRVPEGEFWYAMHDLAQIEEQIGDKPGFVLYLNATAVSDEYLPINGTVRRVIANQQAATELIRIARENDRFDADVNAAFECHAPYFLNCGGFELVSVCQVDVAEHIAHSARPATISLASDEHERSLRDRANELVKTAIDATTPRLLRDDCKLSFSAYLNRLDPKCASL